MKKVDHLVARAFKGAMAFVLAVGLCPVAPAMLRRMALVLALLRRMLLKMTLRIPAFPLTLQNRLPRPTGKPMSPTMPLGLGDGMNGADANGRLSRAF